MTDRLSREDARMLELDSATVKAHTCKVFVIAGAHTGHELCEHVRPRLALVPRLRQRIARVPFGLAEPEWVDDSSFSLRNHIRTHAAKPVVDAQLQALVADEMTRRLDPSRPLWSITVVALEGGRTALVWKFHHCLADGVTAVRLASSLLWDTDADGATGPLPRRWHPRPQPNALSLISHAARDRLLATVEGATRHAAELRYRSPRRLAQRGLRCLPRLVIDLAALRPSSPLAAAVGTGREVVFVDASLARVRSIAHRAPKRATVNDVVLCAVAGGLRRWLVRENVRLDSLRVKVPVSLHHHDSDGELSANRDSFMFVDLPLPETDPLKRLERITLQTRASKLNHDAQVLDSLFGDLSHIPGPLNRLVTNWAQSAHTFALEVSNVVGPNDRPSVMGSMLERFYSVAEVAQGHALRVAVISCADELSFGLCADCEAVTYLGAFSAGITEELDLLAHSVESSARLVRQ